MEKKNNLKQDEQFFGTKMINCITYSNYYILKEPFKISLPEHSNIYLSSPERPTDSALLLQLFQHKCQVNAHTQFTYHSNLGSKLISRLSKDNHSPNRMGSLLTSSHFSGDATAQS